MPPLCPSHYKKKSISQLKNPAPTDTSSQTPTRYSLSRSLTTPIYSLPIADQDNILLALDKCYVSSTLNLHTRTVQHYTSFCNEREIPLELQFPAHEVILLAYAASHIGRFAGGTAKQRISALKTYHHIHNLQWHGSPRLAKVLNGVTLHAPPSTTRSPRSPVTTTMLKHLVKELNLDTPLDACVAACACTAFWSQCRLGELLPASSTAPLLPSSIPTRNHLTRSASKRANHHSYELLLPSTKTNRRGQTVTILKQHHATDPLSLLQHHLAINNPSRNSSLFSYTSSSHTKPVTLSKRRFLARCNAIWSPLGYPRITGHCFRIGGTSKLLASGIPPDVVKTMGRWSSDSFLRYWRHLDKIAPAQTPRSRRKPHKP